jgi:hypothetical protein
MDQGPLVAEQIDAGARFLAEFQKTLPVQAAFWLKDSEEGVWHLYVVSDQITDHNIDVGYREVVRVSRRLRDPWFDLFQVKLIGEDHPLAKAVRELQQRYSRQSPARLNGRVLGGVSVEELYLYPSPLPAPA